MFNADRVEINLLDWRRHQRIRRYWLLSGLGLLLLLFSVTATYGLYDYLSQQQAAQQYLKQQYQHLTEQIKQIEQEQAKQRQILGNQLKLQQIPFEEIVYFSQILPHLPLGEQGQLLRVMIEINPFATTSKSKLNFMLAGENISNEGFYQLQQYLLSHWRYPLALDPNSIQSTRAKQYNFTLRFNEREDN